VTEKQLRADLDVLLELSSDHKDWLGSLRVALVADGFTVISRGAFRRPIQFTAEEGLALLLGLGAVRAEQGRAEDQLGRGGDRIGHAIGTAPS
jgi:hypothetical protein